MQINKQHRPVFINEFGSIVIERYGNQLHGIHISYNRPTILYYCPSCLHNAIQDKEKRDEWYQVMINTLGENAAIYEFKCKTNRNA